MFNVFGNAKLFDTPMLARKYLKDKRLASKLWFTVISISLLRNFFKDNRDVWEEFERRGLDFLTAIEAIDHLEEYLEEADNRVNA